VTALCWTDIIAGRVTTPLIPYFTWRLLPQKGRCCLHNLKKYLVTIILVVTMVASMAVSALAEDATLQRSANGLPVHPSFRAGQNGQVYYTGNTSSESAVTTGPVTIDWQTLYGIQLQVNQGYHLWRLDPVEVARLEGQDLGLNPSTDTFTLFSKVAVGQYSGTGEASVLVQHGRRAYVVQLIQPFGSGARMIWTINSVREVTKPEDAAAIAKKTKTSFTYWGQNGPTVAAYDVTPDYQIPGPPVTQNPNPQTGGRIVYYVRPGDTLWAISAMQGVTVYRLIELNPDINADALWVGQVIIVQNSNPWAWSPATGGTATPAEVGTGYGNRTHIVEPGDTLWAIATRYGVSLQALMNANGITNANVIWAGQKLVIPR
jgi:LysM repeat protein